MSSRKANSRLLRSPADTGVETHGHTEPNTEKTVHEYHKLTKAFPLVIGSKKDFFLLSEGQG